jgi:Beta-ketoacyl synthase, N-terminal domain
MSNTLSVAIEGVGIWAHRLPGWAASIEALCGNVDNAPVAAQRPAPSLLPATERRRAPESVLLAIEVAQQACVMAGREPATLPHVFASSFGDLGISDYLCATLVNAPTEVSPTKFHNSVHNAPAGYWTIATGCRENSIALAGAAATFGAALLEAALLACSEARPVLLVVYDIAACGPLNDVIACNAAFAVALVLVPSSPRSIARLHLDLAPGAAALAPDPGLLQPVYSTNPAARSLPLLRALARRKSQRLYVDAAPELQIAVEVLFD